MHPSQLRAGQLGHRHRYRVVTLHVRFNVRKRLLS